MLLRSLLSREVSASILGLRINIKVGAGREAIDSKCMRAMASSFVYDEVVRGGSARRAADEPRRDWLAGKSMGIGWAEALLGMKYRDRFAIGVGGGDSVS
mmetsp:Transcript_31517/g.53744  ORF Transcript_31517/g.53744 Transcript_31517/m.53744 type:complete len:100 (+) Transcript_31517:493-792(+)